MKLHLGCGNLNLKSYTNIDISSTIADINCDIQDLNKFKNNTIDEIYVCHVLEHFPRRKLLGVLLEWNRVLKKGGILRISVPDFEKVVKVYNKKNLPYLLGFLSGGQKDDYDIHYVNFDFNTLKKILNTCGFNKVERYDTFNFLKDKDDYSKCYIPHMDFKNGELMSLNVTCVKNKSIIKENMILCNDIKKFTKTN